MESQYNREIQIEFLMAKMIKGKFEQNNDFLKKYESFKETRTVPIDITWEKMKSSYGWGYKKGSLINDLVTWIYIRPDIVKDLKIGKFLYQDLTKKLILNKHYFIVEEKAIAFLKINCTQILTEQLEYCDYESSSSSDSSIDYQTIKRRRRILGIDDEAEEA